MAKVYFIKIDDPKLNDKMIDVFDKLSKKLDIKSNDVAVKTHFGEKGNTKFLDPKYVKLITDKIRKEGGRPTLIECNVLYKSPRIKASTHIALAKKHGFTFAPIDICDGEDGTEETEVSVSKKHFKKVKLGKGLDKYKNLVAISHLKGHSLSGFGGAIKNLGMGLGSRAGKLAMHSQVKLSINKKKCIECGQCAENCPVNAITLNPKAQINQDKCINCGKCIAVCPKNAINIPWDTIKLEDFEERMAEYCFGVLKGRKVIYFTFINNVVSECDCLATTSKVKTLSEDIGVIASDDIVAIEQAALDLLKEKNGCDVFKKCHGADSYVIVRYAEKLGLGSSEYELVEL